MVTAPEEELKIPWFFVLLVSLGLGALVLLLILVASSFVSTVWFGYTWPSLKGNGPEDLVSLALLGLFSAIFIPVVRHWVRKELTKVHAKIDEVHDHLDHLHDALGVEKFSR